MLEPAKLMRHVLFLHIPKSGGISVETMIRQNDGPVDSAFVGNFILETDWETVDQHKYFFTHSPLHVRELLPRPLYMFTFLRDPIDRAISAYNHILRQKSADEHQTVVERGLSFVDALANPFLSIQLNDVATRMLGISDPLSKAWPDASAMCLASRWAYERFADEAMYQSALANLERMDFVGFTDRLEQGCHSLARMIGFEITKPITRENVAPDGFLYPLPRAARTSEAEEAVRHFSPFDCRLYDEARKRYDERIKPQHRWHAPQADSRSRMGSRCLRA